MSLLGLINKPARQVKEEVTDTKGKTHRGGRGSGFENELQDACNIYAELKIAYIQKFNPPTVWIPPNKGNPRGFMMFKKGGQAGFDFIGAIIKTKQSIFIEAKKTEFGEIPVWHEQDGIKTHQLETMLWLESVGFECYFLWKIQRAGGVVYKLRPRQIIDLIGEGKEAKKLTLINCDESHMPRLLKTPFRGGEVYDFLGEL